MNIKKINETMLPEIDINLELWNYDVDANNVHKHM